MWCHHCKQEAPALGAASEDGPRCARCNQRLGKPKAPPAEAALERDHETSWREMGHAVRVAKAQAGAGRAARTLRYDMEQTGLGQALAAPHKPARTSPARPVKRETQKTYGASRTTQVFVWFFCTLGAVLLGLGVGLCGWSYAETKPDLWTPGLTAVLAGQGLLIIGLLHMLANLWSAGRWASGKLTQMHDEVRALRRAADESAGRHAASAAHFYADLAQQAGPDVLLGNLRGQVDALAARLRAE